MPLVKRTRATLRSAEFGFFGVCVNTRTHTPRFCGLFCSAGLFVLVRTFSRPLRTSWLIVGTFDNTPCERASRTPNTNRGQSARNRLVAPGLGSRVAARHPELTYPIRFKMRRLGLQGACDGAFPPSERRRLQIGCPRANQNLANITNGEW